MKKQKKIISLMLLGLAVGLVVVVVAASKRGKNPTPPLQRKTDSTNRGNYVRRSKLQPRLSWALNQLGDRLERPGKERTAAIGAIQFENDHTPRPVVLMSEFPDRLRIGLTNGSTEKNLIFDKDRPRGGSQLTETEEALLETLVYDSSEHFFWAQAQQQAARFIGGRIRTDDGRSRDYSGPYYDVYQLYDSIKIGPTEQVRPKFYYFNSDTLLLERVVYQTNTQTNVEVLVSDWRNVNDQRVPHRIERIENGTSKFVLSVNSLNILRRLDDGTFAHTPAN